MQLFWPWYSMVVVYMSGKCCPRSKSSYRYVLFSKSIYVTVLYRHEDKEGACKNMFTKCTWRTITLTHCRQTSFCKIRALRIYTYSKKKFLSINIFLFTKRVFIIRIKSESIWKKAVANIDLSLKIACRHWNAISIKPHICVSL